MGNRNAEMGFAGLSVAAGAKSAVASLWSVSDVGTLALMGEFYSHLKAAPIKSEALRQAQLSMLREDTRLESGQLLTASTRSVVSLPERLRSNNAVDLSHPYYWSGFTMIGNPW
ncbi:MAG: CHAT domain-containing protein [Cyanobacteria bacterium J06627_28]